MSHQATPLSMHVTSIKNDNTEYNNTMEQPKRPLSAYNLFFRDQRVLIMAERAATANHNADVAAVDGGVGFGNMAKMVASRWNRLDTTDKEPYQQRARLESVSYKRAMTAWRKHQRGHLRKKNSSCQKKPIMSPILASMPQGVNSSRDIPSSPPLLTATTASTSTTMMGFNGATFQPSVDDEFDLEPFPCSFESVQSSFSLDSVAGQPFPSYSSSSSSCFIHNFPSFVPRSPPIQVNPLDSPLAHFLRNRKILGAKRPQKSQQEQLDGETQQDPSLLYCSEPFCDDFDELVAQLPQLRAVEDETHENMNLEEI